MEDTKKRMIKKIVTALSAAALFFGAGVWTAVVQEYRLTESRPHEVACGVFMHIMGGVYNLYLLISDD